MAYSVKPISGDSAVFALMAKHITEFKEFPIYMPMLHYAGALASYITAGFFIIFGASYTTYITVGLLCACGWLLLGCLLNHTILDSFGALVSDLLIAIPAFSVLFYALYTAIHAENFIFIPALLLCAIRIHRFRQLLRPGLITAAGFLSGIALWTSPSTFPAITTLIVVLAYKKQEHFFTRTIVPFLLGLLLGYTPAIIYNVQHPGATLFRMAGRLLDLDRSALSSPNLIGLVAHKLCWRLSTIPSSLVNIIRLTAVLISWPLAVIFFLSAAVAFRQSLRRWISDRRIDDIGIVVIYTVTFILFYAILVGENAIRYMVPLYCAAPILIGYAMARSRRYLKVVSACIITAILLYNVSAITRMDTPFRAIRYNVLADWLVKNNITKGYSDYETAYVGQFLSGERALISPTLFHPTFADRWPDQTRSVRGAEDACYIIDTKLYPAFVRIFENSLSAKGQKYRKDHIGDFAIYRGIPATSKPESIDVGVSAKGTR